ncbi:MAG: hypothetical protein DYH18_03360 [Xanthomonadales bacterium PRO7]|jgi:plastocyanin|nr:hypothetical protein [Xanthomonadales bacterium PRO7]HMM55998.1 plastocyanin/azurin family copper-binding protein [Rudaea sp.]
MLKLIWKILLLALSPIAAQAATYTITARNFEFDPPSVSINVGDTVTWVNGGGNHNVVADDNSYVSGAPSTDKWSFSHTFTAAGTSRFFCAEHGGPGGVGMAGIVQVNSVSTTPAIALGGYLSGNWYDPSQGGHGFQLEFTNLSTGGTTYNMLAIWFVYTPVGSTANDGSGQNWIYAQGSYDTTKNTVTLPAVLETGARFPPNFNSADVRRVGTGPNPPNAWGTITFTFTDCNTGTVSWHSDVPGYNNANDTSLPIQRLTQIAGTMCPAN